MNKTITYESEAIAEAMDIPSLTPFVEIVVSENSEVISAKIVEDVMHLYKENVAFKAEVDLAVSEGK